VVTSQGSNLVKRPGSCPAHRRINIVSPEKEAERLQWDRFTEKEGFKPEIKE